MKRKVSITITDEDGVKSGFDAVTVLNDFEIMDAIRYVEPSKCTCQGFYKPANCPIHGRNKK